MCVTTDFFLMSQVSSSQLPKTQKLARECVRKKYKGC
jgi:hypothetical protein